MAVLGSAEQSVGQDKSPQLSHPLLAEALFALDARLRRHHAVVEYTDNPACIFRLGIAPAPRLIVLRDGTRVRRGERIAWLHFWNEHIPPVPESGATIGWARRMQHAIALSLRELVPYLAARADLDDVKVICGEVPCGTREQTRQLGHIMAYYGFESRRAPRRLPMAERIHQFGENILISLLVFAQNAAALRSDSLWRVRVPIYISRRALTERFGSGA